jgi:putative NIF3 family GTP cyclohydrolase 1 type 2
MTAGEAIAKIQSQIPSRFRPEGVDYILDGDPNTPVAKVAVTMMATLDVLKRAAAAGTQLLITHEPLYFNHFNEGLDELAGDPVYEAKRAFVREHGMVVWHQHDQLHDVRPDAIDAGILWKLGWQFGSEDLVAAVPTTPLGDLVAQIAERLNATSLRYVGDPNAAISSVGLNLGFRGYPENRKLIARQVADAVLVGEAWEWETGEYAVDAIELGLLKGLIVTGHIPSEQPGMEHFANWIAPLVPELEFTFIAAKDHYTSLEHAE